MVSVLEEARRAGLFDGEKTEHVSFRAPPALVEAAKREAGISSTSDSGEPRCDARCAGLDQCLRYCWHARTNAKISALPAQGMLERCTDFLDGCEGGRSGLDREPE